MWSRYRLAEAGFNDTVDLKKSFDVRSKDFEEHTWNHRRKNKKVDINNNLIKYK